MHCEKSFVLVLKRCSICNTPGHLSACVIWSAQFSLHLTSDVITSSMKLWPAWAGALAVCHLSSLILRTFVGNRGTPCLHNPEVSGPNAHEFTLDQCGMGANPPYITQGQPPDASVKPPRGAAWHQVLLCGELEIHLCQFPPSLFQFSCLSLLLWTPL